MMIMIDYTWHEFSHPEDVKSITFDGPSDEVQAKMRGFIAGGIWLKGVTIL